jgi:putative SOS response-associated peptidase YedK
VKLKSALATTSRQRNKSSQSGKEEGKKTRKFTTMRWGLTPSWAKDVSIGTQTLNARSETEH